MITDILATQFRFISFVLHANLEGITHEESVRAPRPGGSTINWVAGHITATRNAALTRLGAPPLWTPEDCKGYARGTGIRAAAEARELAAILTDYDAMQEILVARLAGLTPGDLAATGPGAPDPAKLQPLSDTLATFAFHEAYHTGQTGVLRRLLGKPGVIS